VTLETLQRLAAPLKVAVDRAQASAIDRFMDLLLAWNEKINLTAARTREALLSEHLPDSLAMAALVPANTRLLDVGSGGGLPALPFAILRPDVEMTLSEPRAKRAAFLRAAIRELALPRLAVTGTRLDPGVPWPSPFPVASSRATFPPEEWLPLARQALTPEGLVLVFAAHAKDVPSAVPAIKELTYETARHHPRWCGLFRST
jgi:16S rRNA (guanine527-N7)-methyltransferase